MKTFFQFLKIIIVCMLVAGWMRMSYRPVASITWTDLFSEPVGQLLSGMWLMPVSEAIHYYWSYFLFGATHLFIAKYFLREKAHKRTFIKLGMLLGIGGYLLVSALTPDSPPVEDGYFLIIMYSMVGGLFGYLYHRWIAKPEYKAHRGIAPIVSLT